jgi:PleD family two-component response regulator
VDHFKKFNDKHGHDVGDEVLRMVSSQISRVGAGGTAYRYGGEEFCVVFPRKSAEEAAAELDRVREQIADYRMSIRDRSLRPVRSRDGARKRGATRLGSSHVAVTISAGVAERSDDHTKPDAVVMNGWFSSAFSVARESRQENIRSRRLKRCSCTKRGSCCKGMAGL